MLKGVNDAVGLFTGAVPQNLLDKKKVGETPTSFTL